jgi:branched-chain amino acid aminotransferase
MIATNASLGVRPPTSALLYVIASPAGPYHRAGFHAISLEATDAVRAWPGGSGDRKLGANYGPTLVAIAETTKRGFDHNLWLFGEEEYITEAGTMNIFIAIRSAETGQKELITPPLDGMILGGVTRDSILMLAREKFAPMGWLISERQLTMAQLAGAVDRGDLLEVFGTGTAAVVTSIHTISWRYRRLNLMNEAREEGEVASSMRRWIEARQYGDEEHHWRYKWCLYFQIITNISIVICVEVEFQVRWLFEWSKPALEVSFSFLAKHVTPASEMNVGVIPTATGKFAAEGILIYCNRL